MSALSPPNRMAMLKKALINKCRQQQKLQHCRNTEWHGHFRNSYFKKAGMPAHVCNPPREVETGKSQVGSQPGPHQKITEMLLFQLCMYMWGVCV